MKLNNNMLSRTLVAFGVSVLGAGAGCDYAAVPDDVGTPADERIDIDNDEIALAERVAYADDAVGIIAAGPQLMASGDRLTLVATVQAPQATGYDDDGNEVGTFDLQATSVELHGDVAVVSYHQTGAVYAAAVDVIDISDPTRPRLRSTARLDGMDLNSITFVRADGVGGHTQAAGTLYLAGSTVDPQFITSAVVERMELNDYRLSIANSKRYPLLGGVATSVAVADDYIFATSATDGEVVAIDIDSGERMAAADMADARWVAAEDDTVAVVEAVTGTGRLTVYDTDLSELGSFEFDGDSLAASKSTVDLVGGKAFVAAGKAGTRVMSVDSGAMLAELSLPVDSGYDPDEVTTNAVSVSGRYAFSANGALGVHVARASSSLAFSPSSGKLDLRELGALDLAGSANHVAYRDGMLFVAAGTEGLKIIRVDGVAATATHSVSAGYDHSCAIVGDGVKCWGANQHGQAGLGTTRGSLYYVGDDETPASVPGVELVGEPVKVGSGQYHSCALLADGAVQCWGYGGYGTLGYGNRNSVGDDESVASAGTVDVGGQAVDLAVGRFHTCALLDTGDVKCWGANWHGQLGLGRNSGRYAYIGDDETPAQVGAVDLGGATQAISAGYFTTCAVMETGNVRCWGNNERGQLGLGNRLRRNDFLGDNENPSSVDPIKLGGVATSVDVGLLHVCAVLADGNLRCWGENRYGQLGLGVSGGHTRYVGDDEVPASVPAIELGGAATSVSAGYHQTCATLEDGSLRCFGHGGYGALGYGNRNSIGDNETPAAAGPVPVGADVTEVVCGWYHTCVRTADSGGVKCWGANWRGQLGLGRNSGSYRYVGDDEPPSSLSAIDLD